MAAVSEPSPVSESKEDDLNSTFLDLTSFQLHDLDSIELPSSLTELDLTANRLTILDPRIGELSNLKKLSLRQNLINNAAVESLSHWNALSGLEVFNRSSSLCSCFFENYFKIDGTFFRITLSDSYFRVVLAV